MKPDPASFCIRDLAIEWARSPLRPRVDPDFLSCWDDLIAAWICDGRLPLLIRKAGDRGRPIPHCSGRLLILTDNAPAQWCLSSALCGWRPRLEEIVPLLEAGVLPVAMTLSKAERAKAVYVGVMRFRMDPPNLNTRGFRVCHFEDIGMKIACPVDRLDLLVLREHLRRFLSPRNMFLIPKQCAGLGALAEFKYTFLEYAHEYRVAHKRAS